MQSACGSNNYYHQKQKHFSTVTNVSLQRFVFMSVRELIYFEWNQKAVGILFNEYHLENREGQINDFLSCSFSKKHLSALKFRGNFKTLIQLKHTSSAPLDPVNLYVLTLGFVLSGACHSKRLNLWALFSGLI